MQKTKKIVLAFLVVFLILGLFWFALSGDNALIIKSLFTDDLTNDQMIELVKGFGLRGSITLGILSMLQVVLTFLPAEPVQVLSGICYGLHKGMLICAMGVFVGNTVIYVLYKILGEKLSEYFKKNIDVDFEKIKTSKILTFTVFILYFMPAIPYGLICFFAASMGFKYPRYIIITTLCSIPSIFLGVGMGHVAMSTSWIISLVVFAVLVVIIILVGVKRKALFDMLNRFIRKHQKNNEFVVKDAKKTFIPMYKGIINHFLNKVNFDKKKRVKVKTPCIVLCSHGSFIDFAYTGSLLKEVKPHFMVARLYFYNKWSNKFLSSCGVFPKSMFSPDLENVKNCMRVLSDGKVLGMMPEARLSTVGEFEDIADSTFKFIKKMKVPVYGIRLNGSYFAKPKWGDKARKGALVESEFTVIADENEILTIDTAELERRVIEAIKYDDFEWIKSHPELTYKSQTLAEGLENILYKCPKCGKEFTIKTSKRQVFCTECGLTASLDDRYGFTDSIPFENFKEWYHYQKDLLKQEIESTPNYKLTSPVTLKLSSKDGKGMVKPVGTGIATLSIEGLTYEGEINGEQTTKFFPMSLIYRLLFGAGENFEIYENKEIYFFVPEEKRSCVKWYIASEILKNLSEK